MFWMEGLLTFFYYVLEMEQLLLIQLTITSCDIRSSQDVKCRMLGGGVVTSHGDAKCAPKVQRGTLHTALRYCI